MIGKLVTRKLDKEVSGQIFLNGWKTEDICIPCECSPKGENLNNQVDRIVHSVDTSWFLSLVICIITQWAYIKSGHGDSNRGCTWTQEHGLPVTKVTWLHNADCPMCQQQRPTLRPWYSTILQGDELVTWWQIDYIGLLPSWKRQHFVLTWIHNYSGHRFVFPACNNYAKTIICEFTECLIRHHAIQHSIVSN